MLVLISCPTMNKFPRHPYAAALTEICAFRETFGTSLIVMSKVWIMLLEELADRVGQVKASRPYLFSSSVDESLVGTALG